MDATLDDVNLTLDHWVARRCEFTGVWVLDFSESSIALDESLFDELHTCAGPKAAMCVFVFALVLNPGDVPAMQGLARERANTGTLLSVFTDQNSALRWGQRRWAALSEQRVEERAQAVAQGVAVTLRQVGSHTVYDWRPCTTIYLPSKKCALSCKSSTTRHCTPWLWSRESALEPSTRHARTCATQAMRLSIASCVLSLVTSTTLSFGRRNSSRRRQLERFFCAQEIGLVGYLHCQARAHA